MANSNPKMSVIVPVYNGESYLAECLASIERQSLSDIEVLCIDNGSIDESPSIVEAFAQQDNRFKALSYTELQGAAAARNYGIEQAKGEFIAFMDCDDWYPEDSSLEKLYDAALAHGVDIAGGSFSELRYDTGELVTDFSEDPFLAGCFTFTEEGLVDYRSWQGDYGFYRFIYRRSFIEEHKLRFPLYKRHEDPLFMVLALLKAGQFYAIPDVVYRYRALYKDSFISLEAAEDAFDALVELIELSWKEDLPHLRAHQYDVLRWYMFKAKVNRGFADWKDLGFLFSQQVQESAGIRLEKLFGKAKGSS